MSVSWLLLKKSVKQSSGRLLLTALAIALGFVVILLFTASVNALTARQDHSLWRGLEQSPVDGVAPLLVEYIPSGNLHRWRNNTIDITSLRASGKNSPEIPQLPTPGEDEYYTSKTLDTLIKNNPDEQLGTRFGTVNLGIMPDTYTGSPDKLMVVRGMSEAEAKATDTAAIYSFNRSPEPSSFDGLTGFILLFGGTILLFPIIMFLVISTQLGSVQREKRYAAIRLVGATRAQVTRIMLLESLVATLAGIAVGMAAYFAIRIPMAQFYYEGLRFWPNDIAIKTPQFISIALLTLLLSLGATWWGMRRIRTSPLGVVRNQKINKQPRLWRLLPLVSGLSIFAFIATPFGQTWLSGAMADSATPLLLLIGGIVLVMFGFIIAGPWLTSSIAKIFSTKTRNAPTLLASKRISSSSTQVFRSVSGVVLALFAGSFYLTAVSGIDDLDAKAIAGNGYSVINPGAALAIGSPLPDDFKNSLKKEPYVVSTAAAYQSDKGHIIACQNLAKYTELSCPTAAKPTGFVQINFEAPVDQGISIVGAPQTNAKDYLVQLDSNDSIDKLRTLVSTELDANNKPGYVVSGTYSQVAVTDPLIKELAGLAYLGIAVTLFVAIASLIVSTIGGLLERQKSLMTLRLSGMTIGQMRQVVMVESLIPLIAVSLIAASVGVWVGTVFISVLSNNVETMLSPTYFMIVTGALVAATIAIYAILPLLTRLTSFEENRTE